MVNAVNRNGRRCKNIWRIRSSCIKNSFHELVWIVWFFKLSNQEAKLGINRLWVNRILALMVDFTSKYSIAPKQWHLICILLPWIVRTSTRLKAVDFREVFGDFLRKTSYNNYHPIKPRTSSDSLVALVKPLWIIPLGNIYVKMTSSVQCLGNEWKPSSAAVHSGMVLSELNWNTIYKGSALNRSIIWYDLYGWWNTDRGLWCLCAS